MGVPSSITETSAPKRLTARARREKVSLRGGHYAITASQPSYFALLGSFATLTSRGRASCTYSRVYVKLAIIAAR